MQGRLWGPGARDWSELNEPSCVPFYEAVFDAIAVRPGTALLDARCGGGFALQLAAKRGAAVTGLDACGPLLDIARERVPDADLRQGDLESLPFAEHMFDAVTAFNSIQFASDLLAVMANCAGPPGPEHRSPSSSGERPSAARAARHPRRHRRVATPAPPGAEDRSR
jgi:SAM-dependent methyltransferase